jgi:DNA-binding NarL/FixJ family response regulator
VYCFSFKTDLTTMAGVDSYFEAIRSLFTVYESSLELRTLSTSRELLSGSELQPLTQRQEKILELLRSGKTNKSIANEIGYSESLVRHETMIIYKKLRVEGRHELRESV